MRTTKRYSLQINKGKWEDLKEIARLYRDEKNVFLPYYHVDKNYVNDKSHIDQQMRNVKAKFVSPNGLQTRQWKIVQKGAYQTVDKYWCALAEELKSLISQHKNVWTDAEMHYAHWLRFSGKRLAEMVDGEAPIPDKFEVSPTEQKRVRNYLRRVVRRKRGSRPLAKLSRSFELDNDMYSVEENTDVVTGNKKQIIKIMSLKSGKRIVVPLTGYSNFSGNIRIILDFQKQRIEVHTLTDIIPAEIPVNENVVALDAGITEVFMDKEKHAYEPNFGETIKTVSDQLNRTMKARNQSHALKNKSSKHKAHRIAKYNLGKIKLKERKRKGKLRVQQQISQAIREVIKIRKPSTIVTERLDIRGKAKSKGMSRLVSYWMRGSLKERLEFLALVEGFHHQQVNPAFTSQMCPTCLYVHRDNRKGDIFKCLHCGHTDHADRVSAINLDSRSRDSEITVYTPVAIVESILDARFIASLQKFGNGSSTSELSVSGRTDADSSPCQSETPPPNPHIANRRGKNVVYV
jgi:putative transposase